ncbi:PAS domain S-box-containing protein [Trichlorobacter thiogenes]|uniref:Oxygen sensor histidine kinase NreB n=1 Tax=Trichlorobacter thiogenes TaxID=115783 RepID=A0A1T4L048_9BACT|nr:PocR ligand-binding domain-containing protein [Trichlorobacter thiogenes]SJZ48102.1 PAS domain S-box-containing protein [Trichlorobacter thiogenes]
MNNYTIDQLINIQQIKQLLETHVQISGIPCGLMDNDANIIVGVGLQQVCTQYLWEHPGSFARCWRNDPEIKQALENFTGDLFECRCQNGMINIAMPIIVDREHLGVFFSGQFFYDDQQPDLAWFQQQAKELDFDPESYLAAVRQVPLFSRTYVDNTMRFLHQLVQLLAETGYTNLQRQRELEERRQQELLFRESEKKFRTLAENSPDNIARYDTGCRMIYVNPRLAQTLGIPVTDLLGKTPLGKTTDGERYEYQEKIEQVLVTGENAEIDIILPDSGEGKRHHNIRFVAERGTDGAISGVLAIGRDITERKQAEQERLANLHFLSCMERINRAIQLSTDLEQMMSDVLDVVLSIFDCDRAYLLYPCDPDAKSWQIPMERTTVGYPGSKDVELAAASNDWIAKKLRLLLYSNGALRLGIGTPFPLSGDLVDQLGIKNILATAIYPKVNQPWEFGIHQCTHIRTWSPAEKHLFQEIGRRLTDGMTSLLIQRNLQESERRYRMVFENSPVSIWEEDFSGIKLFFNQLRAEGIDNLEEYLDLHPEQISICAALVKVINVNQATLALHGATDRQGLLEGLIKTFTPESLMTFRQELLALWQGRTRMQLDSTVKTLSGELRQVTVYVSVCPGYEDTLGKCVVSLVDITDRKSAEQELREKQQHLNDLLLELTLSEERERRRIAVDLHDTLGQDLTLTRMKLGTLHKTPLSSDQGTLVSDIKLLTDSSINRVRSLTRLLCPAVLDGAGLEAALKWLARQIETDYHLQIAFHDDLQEKQVGKELQIELYNSVRELLINIAKHAGTSTACLSVYREADTLAIRVEDDGVGFDVATVLYSPSTEGFGLFTIRRRIIYIGGVFQITSKQGSGTEVAINVPLAKQAPPDTTTGEQP